MLPQAMPTPSEIRRSKIAGRTTTQLARYLESPDLCPEAVVIDLGAERTSRFSASYLMRLIAEELNRRGQEEKK